MKIICLFQVCEQLSGVYKVAVVYNHPHLLMFIQLSVGGHSIDGTATLTDTNIEQIVEAHLLEQLPVYYLPDSIIVVQQIPFTHHGNLYILCNAHFSFLTSYLSKIGMFIVKELCSD